MSSARSSSSRPLAKTMKAVRTRAFSRAFGPLELASNSRIMDSTTSRLKTAEGFEDRKQALPRYPQIIAEPESYAGNAKVGDDSARSNQARTFFRGKAKGYQS